MTVEPIVLTASGNEEALVTAIARATAQGVPLLLGPGTHLTKRGRANTIPITGNGLTVGPESLPPREPPTIMRPDRSIDLAAPDDNHGLFFVPAKPSENEENTASWTHYQRGTEEFEFAVIIRGKIRIEGLRLDCNMGTQGLENIAHGGAEHSCMLGFAGRKYPAQANPNSGMPRFIFVGFESVELSDIVTAKGGFADEIWFSRGYFNPNIVNVTVNRLVSTSRIGTARATLDFSRLCQNITVTHSQIFKLGLEATDVPYREMPRMTPEFLPSVWTLTDLTMAGLDLGAHGRSYVIHGSQLTTTDQCIIHEPAGEITDSTLRVDEQRRLIRMNDFVFRRVHWIMDAGQKGGASPGLKITSQHGEPCSVSFFDNVFTALGPVQTGEILNSEYSPAVPGSPANKVNVTASGCLYPSAFGFDKMRPVARVNERGFWTFARADLHGREPDVALPRHPAEDVHRFLIP